MATEFQQLLKLRLSQADPMKLSFDGIYDVVLATIFEFKRNADGHEPISDENFAAIVTEQWAEEERKRIKEELRQLYVDMSEMRDRVRGLFPTLSDPSKCGSCGGNIIRGDRVAPMGNGRLKHLRCEGGPDAEVLKRTAQAQRAESDAAWILFRDRQGGA